MNMAAIDEWRKKIDQLDKKLVELLNERAKCTDEIGKLKQEYGLDAYSPEREGEILRNVLQWNKGPMPVEALRRLYERILDESRKLEREAMRRRKGNSSGEKNNKSR